MLTGFDVYIRRVVENGQPIFPEAYCMTEVERLAALAQGRPLESIERLKQTNKEKFYGQYLNDPLDSENLEFKRAWFKPFDLNSRELVAQLQTAPALISVDPAFRLHQRNDFSGLCVTKVTQDNNVYVLEARQVKANPAVLMDEIFQLVATYAPVYKVLVETVTAQIILLDLLQAEMKKRGVFFSIEEVRPVNNETKPMHIRGLIPHYANGRIWHRPGLFDLENQLIEFPKNVHDDLIDALAYQVRYWQPARQMIGQQQVPEGSYAWWQKRSHTRPTQLGKLFNDFRR